MPRAVIGPLGNVLTLENLPPPNTVRWSKRRKCELLAAIDANLLSRSDACSLYRLGEDEISAWRHALTRFGIEGLSARWPRNPKRGRVAIPLQQRLLGEVLRLAELARAARAEAAAVILDKAAAELHAMNASDNARMGAEGHVYG
jgi:hypothetical protein